MDLDRPIKRRRFVQILAAGAATLLVPGSRDRALAAATKPRKAPPPAAHPNADPRHPNAAAIAREVAKQKKSLAETVKTLRDFELPPGSPPASVFRAMKRKGA
ncbi:MAG: hypothetical protein ACM3JJ_09375 [Hyphomicrobiales bacterium]